MPGIARNGVDVAGGVAIEGSSNVNANGSGVVRIGDKVASHGVSPHSPTPPMVGGSSRVFANVEPVSLMKSLKRLKSNLMKSL